ncbi:leucine-rich repeat domain-containing protein [Candidatus Bipolaricaulota bacterium]|nr:leucine-rich repeat domain-containing protein [Candidatus Bipolaricaulota bacterium]
MNQRHQWCPWILLLIVTLTACPAQAVDVVFPDPALHQIILDTIGKDGEPIDSASLELLTSLLAGSKGIADLSGLEACTSLEQLQLHNNQIIDLEPLAGLRELTSISLNGNQIVDVGPLAAMSHLTSLAIHSNAITDARPIASLPLLESLSIGNSIESIEPLIGLPRLARLLAYVLPSTDLSHLLQMPNLELLLLSSGRTVEGRPPFECSNLANCINLASLRLEGYDLPQVAELINYVPALSELALYYVGVDDLAAFRGFNLLTQLTLSGVIPSSAEAVLSQLSVPPTVSTLVLENNAIEDVSALAGFSFLTNLDLARNRITSVESLRTLNRLIVLDLSFNPITDLTPLRELTALKSLTLQGVPFDRTEGSSANLLIHELLNRGVDVYY